MSYRLRVAPPTRRPWINADRVSKSFGIKHLLDTVSLGCTRGSASGSWASTAAARPPCRRFGGITEPDSGRVSRAGDIRVETVTQRGELPAGATVSEAVVGADVAEHEWAGDARRVPSSPVSVSTPC